MTDAGDGDGGVLFQKRLIQKTIDFFIYFILYYLFCIYLYILYIYTYVCIVRGALHGGAREFPKKFKGMRWVALLPPHVQGRLGACAEPMDALDVLDEVLGASSPKVAAHPRMASMTNYVKQCGPQANEHNKSPSLPHSFLQSI